jgi:hypothetical protein
MSSNISLFQRLGLTVVSCDSGVYHLQRRDEQGELENDMVGLLFSAAPLGKQAPQVKLFLQETSQSAPAARIVFHWQTLDARRFEESGMEPREVDVATEIIPDTVIEQRYTRPDGARIRHAAKPDHG